MPDEVDATMNRPKPSIANPALDRMAANAASDELSASNDPVLSVSEPSDQLINRSKPGLDTHEGYNPDLNELAPSGACGVRSAGQGGEHDALLLGSVGYRVALGGARALRTPDV